MSQLDRTDGLVGNTAIKAPVRVASTGNLVLSGFQTVDGQLLAASDENLRVLVRSQTDTTQNGIWDADSGDWTRAQDFDGNDDVATGSLVKVNAGTLYGNTYWRVSAADPIVIDTSSITFAQALATDSATVSFLQAGVGAQTRTMQAKERDILNMKDFATGGIGTVASPWTGWDTVFANNLAAGVSAFKEYWFSEGYYSYANPLVLNSPNGSEYKGLRLAGHGEAIVTFTGNGRALSITADDVGHTVLKTVYNVGMENLKWKGNPNCTDVLYIMSVHHSVFRNLRLEECTGAALRVAFSVENIYEIVVSGSDVGVYTTKPTNGIVLQADPIAANSTTGNTFIRPIIEGVSGAGIVLTAANGNVFIGGTSEANAKGITIAAGCERNTFKGVDMESNTTMDVEDSGTGTTLDGCVGQGNGLHLISGRYQNIIGGSFETVLVDVGTIGATFSGMFYNRLGAGAFTNNSLTTLTQNVRNYTTGATDGIIAVAITDATGTGPVVTTNVGRAWANDPQNIRIRVNFTCGVVVNGANNLFTGLPYAAANLDFFGGVVESTDYVSAAGLTVYILPNSQTFRIYDGATALTNSNCSGKSFIILLQYSR